MEDLFIAINGVTQTEVGYANGTTKSPTYKDVCAGNTGHEEVVKIIYDDNVVSLKDLLGIFFKNLDPTKTYNDYETVQRENQSAVIFTSAADLPIILKTKSAIESEFGNPLLTRISPLSCYYKAEDEHQQHLKKNPDKTHTT